MRGALGELGRHEHALAAVEEAVAIRRALVGGGSSNCSL